MEENRIRSIVTFILKGFPHIMQHTPNSSISPEENTPLIAEVLAFFESVLKPAPSEEEPDAPRKRGNPGTLSWAHL